MKLAKKKKLAAKTLGIGVNRIIFDSSRLDEIKEAITKKDFRDLEKDGAVKIKQIVGRKKKEKRKTKKRGGKIRKKIKKRKETYAILTKKLRKYAKELKNQKKISLEEYYRLRKQIKTRIFKNKKHLQNYLVSAK